MLVRPFARAAALLVSLSMAVAQSAAPTVEAVAAWQQFRERHPGQWLVQWHAATGTPGAIFGDGYALAHWRGNTLDEARRHAHAELARHATLLGLGASDFREVIGARMGRTWTFTFAQHFRGVPVLGGSADVRIHMLGRVVHLGSTAWPVPADFDVTPTLDAARAEAAAWLALGREPGAAPQPGTTRLVIHGDRDAAAPAPFGLAWEVPISAVDAAGNGPIGRAYVDAKGGALLAFVNDKHECGAACSHTPREPLAPVPTTFTVMAWTHSLFSPVSAPTNEPVRGLEVAIPGHGVVVTDQNGQFTVDLAAPVAVNVIVVGEHCGQVIGANAPSVTATLQPGVPQTLQLGSAGGGEQELAHATTYHWTDKVNRWARGILGNTPELAVASNVFPTVNIASTCNAYYVGNSINFYRSGGGCNNTAGASVIAHEWGHGLDDRYGGISQTDGLSEGWGDICSIYLLDDAQIGHDFFLGGGGIRNGNNTHQYGTGSGPHAQGQSWMGFAWKFRNNLRASLGTPQAIAISNDVVIGSIAANAFNQPNAVLAAFQADDDDAFLGNGTPHSPELIAACNVHGLPWPQPVPGYLVHTPLANTRVQGEPRRVVASAIPITGHYTQVRLHWNDGQPQQRVMVPTGIANEYHALLPGKLAPQVVQYHVEGTHSGGAVHRLPASGEYQYATIAERRVWFEDFESGGAGWTHGATAGNDDWQIGAPVAQGGVWTDPGAAASGIACAGTDLGSGSDGAYSASSDAWLRSPPIDCSGVTGVRLRFKRWASCAGPSDRLEVRVNGQITWLTSFAPLLDTAWATYDTSVAVADNHPAVVLEFRIVSDAFVQYGGWNLDDVELYSLGYAVPIPARLALLPEQAQQGTPITLQANTPPNRPVVLVLGDTPGPTSVPGLPTLLVGGNAIVFVAMTDATGQFATTFAAPVAAATGTWFWSQFLTLDAGGALVTSNPFVSLFTP